jgi:hypothetical protein
LSFGRGLTRIAEHLKGRLAVRANSSGHNLQLISPLKLLPKRQGSRNTTVIAAPQLSA